MARYVLVEFDDNDMAKRFVTQVNGDYRAVDPDFKTRRVRAVWGKPTLYCECSGGKGGMNPWRRGAKSGWWVHDSCGRPSKAWSLGNHWFSALGRNLLPYNKDYLPQGWGLMRAFDEQTGHITPTGEATRPTGEADRKAARRKARKELKAARPRAEQ